MPRVHSATHVGPLILSRWTQAVSDGFFSGASLPDAVFGAGGLARLLPDPLSVSGRRMASSPA